MAEHAEIIDEIEALAVHCRPPLMAAEQRQRWAVDWASDLAKFPIEAIRNAFRAWRHGDNGKFPTPGQIMPAIRAQVPSATKETAEPWRPLTDAEYAALTVREKIRHHRIMAHECRQKAGPQWKHGKAIPADQMSDHWREMRRRAANHDEEAKRMQDMLTQMAAE